MKFSTPKAASIKTNRWFKLVWMVPAAFILLLAVVLTAQWARELSGVQSFIAEYPGESQLPASAPVGFPAWLGWQHFLNTLMIVLLIRSGWNVRTNQRPGAYWTRDNTKLIRTKSSPVKISLDLWFHLTLAAFWVVNGIAFYVLLFATGQWTRLVPTSWDVFPNAASTAIQYASLNWPNENGWLNYNSLQLLAYFSIVFIAAPLAMITGIRMSGAWPTNAKKLSKIYPIQLARSVHFPVMLYFVGFIIVHVTLVLATSARNNLNHMYAMRDDTSWLGFWIFAASLVVIIVLWVAAQPLFLRPVAALTGKISRR